MFKKLAPFIVALKADFAGAVDAQSKKTILEDARTVADELLANHPGAITIVDLIFDAYESTIK